MRRFCWVLGFVLAATMAGGRAARAQTSGDTELTTNWLLRAGFFVPERSPVRAAQGDVFFTFGAERSFFDGERYQATIGIDYYGSGSVYNVPITINLRGETNRLRYGAGMGVGLAHDLTHGFTGFTWNLLIGYTLRQGSNPITADVRYMALEQTGDLNGWAFTLGYHF